MNEQLQNALNDLARQNATQIPDAAEIEQAADDTEWTGALPDGIRWSLKKHNSNSYTVSY